MLEKPVPADVSNAGTDANDEQPENMPEKLVPADVSNAGTDANDGQPENMPEKSVPADVSNAGADANDEQLLNMLEKLVTFAVQAVPTIELNARRLRNMALHVVIAVVPMISTCSM